MTDSTTIEQHIAEWMVEQIKNNGTLKQEDAIAYVRAEHGEEYIFTSESGNVSLSKEIKKLFASTMQVESHGIETDFSGHGHNSDHNRI